jgi:DNA-binding CsgD family transcriptional regulator
MNRINFLIISGSYICKTGLRFLLEELDVTGKIFLAEDVDKILKTQADILFVDTSLTLPEELLDQWRDYDSRPVLVGLVPHNRYTPQGDKQIHQFFLDLSLSKSELLNELQKIIRESGFEENATPREGKLSDREKTILRYVALGFTNREIAEKLFISTHTVITHRKNITRKIGIKTVSGLTVYALLNHLIEMGDLKEQTGGTTA